MKGPERIETTRLVLRKPAQADAGAIFARYASDPEVTRYLGWPRHQTIEQTKSFLAFSEAEWNRWPAGPYLIESLGERKLLGSTGLAFETPAIAATGYVLESSPSLSAPDWSLVSNVTGTSVTVTPTGSSVYYRLRK